jgi:3-oxoacyl-[acyl-carrier protein] reductase/meso-butanediol dehydrogenase/(S,S)-butanediol dehydrogenase/diacetyl reductase
MSLIGKIAIVTGAGRMRGTGHSIALTLAREGCDVVLHGSGSSPESWPQSERDAGWRGLEAVADQVKAIGRRALIATADLRSSAEVDAMVADAVAEFGHVDILINNAAAPKGTDRTEVVNLTDEVWKNVLSVKLDGAFNASRAVARHMIERGGGGRIVNISSGAGKNPQAKGAAYSTANAGLQMFGASLALELAQYGITVNTLCPGVIATSRIDDLIGSDAYAGYLAASVPMNRAGTAEEVADAVAFLCGDGAAYITAQSINIDGGMISH